MRLIITSDLLSDALIAHIVAAELICYYTKDVRPKGTPQGYLDATKDLWGPDGFRERPYRSEDGPWWELDGSNDHKLDILGGGRYAFRDRYSVPAKVVWVEKALKELGIEVHYE